MGRYTFKGSQNLSDAQVYHLYHGLGETLPKSINMFSDIQKMRNASYERNFLNGHFSEHKSHKCPGNLAGAGFWFRKK